MVKVQIRKILHIPLSSMVNNAVKNSLIAALLCLFAINQ